MLNSVLDPVPAPASHYITKINRLNQEKKKKPITLIES